MPVLEPNEQLIARRERARLTRANASGLGRRTSEGELYLTDRRLIHDNGTLQTFELVDIAEVSLVSDSLLVSLRDGDGLRLEVASAAELRAEIADQLRLAHSPSR